MKFEIENGRLLKCLPEVPAKLIKPTRPRIRVYTQELDMEIPFGIKTIDKQVFDEVCSYVQTVKLPDGLNKLQVGLFKRFINLEELVIGEGPEIIPAGFLKNSIKLKKIVIPSSVKTISNGGFDDVFVMVPVPALFTLAEQICAFDGCVNFFAGPLDKKFSANFNFYNVHYAQHHVSGTSGSTPEDMRDIVKLLGENRLDPSVMITHVGGIDAAIDTTVNLPKIPGGKKLIYTHIELPLTALTDFEKLGETDERFKVLDGFVKANNGLWCTEAEKYLLENFK